MIRTCFLRVVDKNLLFESMSSTQLPSNTVVCGLRMSANILCPNLKYLSRYLYRGVIGENNIVSNQNGNVTFKYVHSRTGETRYRTVKGEDFLWLVLQHVLPKGFRRVRDYGFLHGNAKKLLSLVQMLLKVLIESCASRPRPVFKCPKCQAPMKIIAFKRAAWASG